MDHNTPPDLSGVFFIQPSPGGISKHEIDAPANASPKISSNNGNKQSSFETACVVLEREHKHQSP